jgi:recombinational DNA repair protein (RecF pathway)
MELKRCLRCGSNHVEAENSDSFVGVFCHDCPCAVEDYSLSFEELVDVWNIRPIEDELLEEISRLTQIIIKAEVGI